MLKQILAQAPAAPAAPSVDSGELSELGNTAKDIWQTLLSPELQAELLPFKVIFIFVTIAFIIMFFYLLFTTNYAQWRFWRSLTNFLFPKVFKNFRLIRKWKKIKKAVGQANVEAQWKLALLEGAELVNKFSPKDTLEELTKDDISDLEEFKKALQTCQNTRQDPNFRLEKKQAQEIIDVFEKALADLDIF